MLPTRFGVTRSRTSWSRKSPQYPDCRPRPDSAHLSQNVPNNVAGTKSLPRDSPESERVFQPHAVFPTSRKSSEATAGLPAAPGLQSACRLYSAAVAHFHRSNRIPMLIIGSATVDFAFFIDTDLFLKTPVVGSRVGNPYTAPRDDTDSA